MHINLCHISLLHFYHFLLFFFWYIIKFSKNSPHRHTTIIRTLCSTQFTSFYISFHSVKMKKKINKLFSSYLFLHNISLCRITIRQFVYYCIFKQKKIQLKENIFDGVDIFHYFLHHLVPANIFFVGFNVKYN